MEVFDQMKEIVTKAIQGRSDDLLQVLVNHRERFKFSIEPSDDLIETLIDLTSDPKVFLTYVTNYLIPLIGGDVEKRDFL